VTGRPELDPRLEQRILETTEPVTLYLFTGSPSAAAPFSPVPELEVHLERVCRKSPLLRWERIQAASSGPRAAALAARFGLNLAAMEADSTGILEGRLVAATAVRHHVIRLSDLFVMDVREDGVVFHGVALQSALSRGLARLQRPDDTSWCFTRGHQERQITDTSAGGLTRLAAGLQFSGISTREIDLISPVPTNCRLLFSADPRTELMSAEEENLATALREGRTGLVLATHEYNQLPASWRRPLQDCHLGFSDAVAEDPELQLRSGEPGRFLVPWPGRNGRLLLTRPLILVADRSAVPLLNTSGHARHIERRTGRVEEEKTAVLAARSGPDCASRILALGFSDAFSNDRLTIGGQSSDASMNWLMTQLRWAAAEPADETMPIFEMEHHKLVLPQSQVARIQTFALLLWPLFALAVGLWVARRRRA